MSTQLEEAAQHWERLAVAQAELRDFDVATFGHSPNSYDARIDMYKRTVQALRLEIATGRAHCACCLSPEKWHR